MVISLTARQKHARAFIDLADTEFFKALCEPIRIQILGALVELGRADITSLAERFTQDRSVISRHLSHLESCGIVHVSQEGRNRFYAINGQHVLQNFEALTAQLRSIISQCGC